jgi:hypothetical protein
LSPHGGRFLLAQDLEGGLAFFALDDKETGDAVWGPLGGGRLAALPVGSPPGAGSGAATTSTTAM